MQAEQKSMGQSKMAFRETPKAEGEGVIIFIDEQKEFDESSEMVFGQYMFEKYSEGSGFSLVFWIMFTSLPRTEKQKKGRVSYISLFVRNRFSSELIVGAKDNFLFVELNTPKKEKAYSEKELKNGVWYQVGLVSSPDAELHELSLYINGNPDSSVTYTDFDPFYRTEVQFGRFKGIGSFSGLLCDASLSFFPLSQEEIAQLYSEGKKELKQSHTLSTSKNLYAKTQDSYLRTQYSKKKKVPANLMSSIAVDPRVLEEEEVIEAEVREEEQNAQEQLKKYFLNNPAEEARWELTASNFDWLITVVSIMATGSMDKSGKIEIRRLLQALVVMQCEINHDEVVKVGKLLGAIDGSSVYYFDLLMPVKMLLAPPVEEEEIIIGGEKEEKKAGEREKDEDEEEGKEEEEPPMEEEKLGVDVSLPLVSENWNNGEFTIVVNRCHDCNLHETYSRHTEEKFVDAFNEVGYGLKKVFPNVVVIGNYEKVTYMEGFDVYIRGVGPSEQLDETGRLMLFSKAIEKRMPSAQEIVDKVILLSFTYGDSLKLAEAQSRFLKINSKAIPRPYKKVHKHPMSMPETVKVKRVRQPVDMDDIKKVCLHWGCGETFTEKDNHKTACTFHPGKFEFGSEKGWWPEGWSCCRSPWDNNGCKKGKHVGIPLEDHVLMCVNHGEIGPDRPFPDSFCGSPFKAKEGGECMIHPGYIKRNMVWSCCGVHMNEASPCQKMEHKAVKHPEEEAKIYFFNAPIVNPGLERKNESDYLKLFKKFGRFSGYFKKVEEYKEKTKQREKSLTKEEQDVLDAEKRYCLHWGCEKPFCNAENVGRKPCRFHPGKWDFGHSGISITQAMEDKSSVLWSPHWTCCRRGWKSLGCTFGEHRGPLLKKYQENPRQFKWPDLRAQVFFRKKISSHWLAFLEKHRLDIKQVEGRFHYFASTKGSDGKISLALLPMLLDQLKLHLLVLSEDLSYHFKYLMVIKGKVSQIIDDGDGNVDKEKFLSWWKLDLDQTLKMIESLDFDEPEEEEERKD